MNGSYLQENKENENENVWLLMFSYIEKCNEKVVIVLIL